MSLVEQFVEIVFAIIRFQDGGVRQLKMTNEVDVVKRIFREDYDVIYNNLQKNSCWLKYWIKIYLFYLFSNEFNLQNLCGNLIALKYFIMKLKDVCRFCCLWWLPCQVLFDLILKYQSLCASIISCFSFSISRGANDSYFCFKLNSNKDLIITSNKWLLHGPCLIIFLQIISWHVLKISCN